MLYLHPCLGPQMLHSGSLDWLFDFLAFRTLIAPSLLILTYYLGAVLIAALVIDLTRRFHRQLVRKLREASGEPRMGNVPLRARVAAFAVAAFLIGEIGWRMMFEFLLAYFQMHDALLRMSGS